jgi:hypothetical protein
LKIFFFYSQIVGRYVCNRLPTTILLKNVSSTMNSEVKLISTSSSIIFSLVFNTKAHEQLELVHKTLTSGTSFRTNLEIILNVFFTFFFLYEFFFTRCVGLLFYFNVEDCKNIWYILKLFVQILDVLTLTSPSVAPFEMVCKKCNFTTLRLLLTHPQAPWWTQLRVQRRKQQKEKELGHVPWLIALWG